MYELGLVPALRAGVLAVIKLTYYTYNSENKTFKYHKTFMMGMNNACHMFVGS